MLQVINYHFCRDGQHINGGLTIFFTLSPSTLASIRELIQNDPRKLKAWRKALMAMVKHLPFINLITHAWLDWKMFKEERGAANAVTDALKKEWEHDAKRFKGKLQMFKMNEAFFESLPQVSQMSF